MKTMHFMESKNYALYALYAYIDLRVGSFSSQVIVLLSQLTILI